MTAKPNPDRKKEDFYSVQVESENRWLESAPGMPQCITSRMPCVISDSPEGQKTVRICCFCIPRHNSFLINFEKIRFFLCLAKRFIFPSLYPRKTINFQRLQNPQRLQVSRKNRDCINPKLAVFNLHYTHIETTKAQWNLLKFKGSHCYVRC